MKDIHNDFTTLRHKAREGKNSVPSRMLAIDPGHTVGWAYFEEGELANFGQIEIGIDGDKIIADGLWRMLEWYMPERVIVENYRVYPHKAQSHSWNALITPRLIGYIESICACLDIQYQLPMASSKQFCTNEKLKGWGYYQVGSPHANDAIRHGCYWLLFGKEN